MAGEGVETPPQVVAQQPTQPEGVTTQQQPQPSPEVAPQETQSQMQPQTKSSIMERVSGFVNRLTGKGSPALENQSPTAVDSAGNPLQPEFTESQFAQQVRKGEAPGLDKGTGGLHPLGTIDAEDQDRARLAQYQIRNMADEARQKNAQQLPDQERSRANINEAILESQGQSTPAEVPTQTPQQPVTTEVPTQTPQAAPDTDLSFADKVLRSSPEELGQEVAAGADEALQEAGQATATSETTVEELEQQVPQGAGEALEKAGQAVEAEAAAPPPPVAPAPTEPSPQTAPETGLPQTETTVPVSEAAPEEPIPVRFPQTLPQTPTPVGVSERPLEESR